MNCDEIMKKLEELGSEQIKKIHISHGAKEPLFGVKVGDLKPIQKKVGKNYELSLELYNTGNSDAMYLAGLIADEKKMTKEDLNGWIKKAYWSWLSEYTVPWVAAESNYGLELALEWMESNDESIASAGWSVMGWICALKKDDELDLTLLKDLIKVVETEVHSQANRVRYTMNGFITAVGSYVLPLRERAIEAAKKNGNIHVDMGGTACKVPDAVEHINKYIKRNPTIKKKKTVRC
ncbi:MAG: DNA alkylation repair protein [Candidatus Kapaibacterium sp.]|jgi:3-methyladenine DNA glycosylase AlkD|nr:DNA alkylation repair protein [Candidatus Kapabacteria bacterium]